MCAFIIIIKTKFKYHFINSPNVCSMPALAGTVPSALESAISIKDKTLPSVTGSHTRGRECQK